MSIHDSDRIELVLERMQSWPSLSWEPNNSHRSTIQKQLKEIEHRTSGICADPVHLHSFAKEFSLSSFIRIRKCEGCQNRFLPGNKHNATKNLRILLDYASGKENDFLRCVACGIYAHRSCVFNRGMLDACKIHKIALEERKLLQQNLETEQTDLLSVDESSMAIDSINDMKKSMSSSIIVDSIAMSDGNFQLNEDNNEVALIKNGASCSSSIETREDDTSNIIWTLNGPPVHFAKIEPIILSGIKSNTRARPIPEKRAANPTLEDNPATADGCRMNEELSLGESFLNTSKLLQETLFRYLSRSSKEKDKIEAFNADGLVSNNNITLEENYVFDNEVQQQQIQQLNYQMPEQSSSERDPEIPFHLLKASPSKKNRETTMILLENTLKGIRIDTFTRWASGAGSFAGGLAGLLMAGPTGMYVGSSLGAVACVASVVGLILEGPIGVGILVVSVAGTLLAKNAEAKEKRLLTLGDDKGKLVMVRSNVIIDPIWMEIFDAARKSIPSSVLPVLTTTAEKRRRLRDINIISSDESELTFTNKIFLLVSSSLNDKKSPPGHVYSYLMKEYRKRASKHAHERLHNPPQNHNITCEITRATRDDTHAVIKYTTMILLEARQGLSSSFWLEEMTFSMVESLLFGEVYDLVFREILDETREIDNSLMTKISDFQVSAKTDFEDYVSERALHALRLLPEAHSVEEKLNAIVQFLEEISYLFSIDRKSHQAINADNLLEMVCQHLIVAKVPHLNAEIAFVQEFAKDNQLLKGKEGYALVTLQAALHFMNLCQNFQTMFEEIIL